MRAFRLLLFLLLSVAFLFPVSNVFSQGMPQDSNGVFQDWYRDFYAKAAEAQKAGPAASSQRWGGIAAKCKLGNATGGAATGGTATDPFQSGMGFFETKDNANKILYCGKKSKNSITFEDQLNAAMYNAHAYDPGGANPDKCDANGNNPGRIDYKARGELLVKHPLAVPVNLAVWCVANQAQNMLPLFCMYAVRLFGMLLIIEFVWMAMNWILKAASLGQIIDGLVTKIHVWTFLGCFILTGFYGFTNENWMYTIFSSFNQIGETVVENIFTDMASNTTNPQGNPVSAKDLSSLSVVTNNQTGLVGNTDFLAGEALSPGSFFAMGIMVISSVWSKVSFGFDIVSLLIIPVLIFVTPIILATFSKMVADIALTMLEGYLGLGIMLVLIAFGAARWGTDYIQKVLLYGVMMGFKLLCLYSLFGIGVRMMAYVALSVHYVQGMGDFITALFSMLAITLMMSFLFHRLPQAAGALFAGSPTMSFGQLLKDTMENIEGGNKALSLVGKAAGKVAGAAGKYSGATKQLSNLKAAAGKKVSGSFNKISGSSGGGGKVKKESEKSKGGSDKKKGGDDKKEGKGKAGAAAAKKAGSQFSAQALKDMGDDAPSTGNFITPDVKPPGDD